MGSRPWGFGPDVFSLFVEQPNACLHATIAPHALAGLGQVSVRAAGRARAVAAC